MPLQNRVTPEGEFIADPARGRLMGNRGGRLHDQAKALGARRWASKQWIACRLEYRDRQREVMGPRGYTELFFLDEATALAAGHRPCFECRRQDAQRFAAAWAEAHGLTRRPSAAQMDQVLHAERLTPDGAKRTFRARLGFVPEGAIVRGAAGPWLRLGNRVLDSTPAGYRDPCLFDPRLSVEVLTPPCIIAVLKIGYVPLLHESAHLSR
jgi:hypothetical protein